MGKSITSWSTRLDQKVDDARTRQRHREDRARPGRNVGTAGV